MTFDTVKPYRTETEIRRSRFIAVVERVRGEDEMFARLNAIRKEFSDATHVPYAAVTDEVGMASRFSDDGEPGGTSGQPILDAIRGANLAETLVAVVRYFGGVKLGAGGLVRAYSAAAKAGLSGAVRVRVTGCDAYALSADFAGAKRAAAAMKHAGYIVTGTDYTDRVTISFAVPEGSDPRPILADALGMVPGLVSLGTLPIETDVQRKT